MCTIDSINKELCAPFPANQVKWIPKATNGDKTRALAVPYIDPRDVAERLDQVLGPLGWAVDHKNVAGQTITGIGINHPENENWIWKWDVGFNSSSDDEVSVKGSVSDGLKRAAILWGIGRYLRRVEGTWVDYDSQKKKLKKIPQLPEWALPGGEKSTEFQSTRTHVPIDQDMAQDVPELDPEGPPPDQKLISGNGNGKVGDDATTQFWLLVRSVGISPTGAREILDRNDGDFGKALQILRKQHTPPEPEELPF